MPLKKFAAVKNVGRLVNCSQKGPELNRYNLFFAENGRGKTTLCAVLRSLQTGQSGHIEERKTIGPAGKEQEASVRLDTGMATFGKKGWSGTVPEIAIFDATFVAKNVHAGEYVSRDQRASLLEVIVGEAGVVLAKEVSRLDDAIRDKNGEVGRATKGLQQALPAGTKLDQFLSLAAVADIDARIKLKCTERDAARQAEAIKARAPLSELALPAIPHELLPLLAKTLADVAADAEQRVKHQIASHEMHDRGEAWLSEGLAYLRDDKCPFCGQATAGIALIEAYKQFFSEAYNALLEEIAEAAAKLNAAMGETTLAKIGQVYATNEAALAFWKQFAVLELPLLDIEAGIAPPVRRLREVVSTMLAQKQANPLAPVAASEEFTAALNACSDAVARLTAYNASVTAADAVIADQKTAAQIANVAMLEKELVSLTLVKLRHDPKVKPLCEEHIKLTAEKAQLDKDKANAKAALDAHADKMIRDYEATINKLLKGFGAGFSITNSRKTYIGGTPTSAYQILINNRPIDLGDGATPIGQPCFRTTLSAGDKSTLALAFFLAQLDHDPNKADRIVVFDDPFNSQDRSRRERTAELLRKYGQECAQLLLFSHDPFFLALVYRKLPKAERHSLQLSRAPDNTTTIEEWDVEKETQEGYFKDHAALSSYLLNGAKNLIDIARKIRPVLEGYMRYRFPHQFPDNEWLGDMIKRIRDSAGAHPMSAALEELESINDFSKKYHHDTNPGKADSEPINDGELQSYAQRTLAIVGGY